MPVEEFFVDYGKQDMSKSEFLERIHVPRPRINEKHAAYKISKRRDEDISSVCAAFNVTVENGNITAARIAFGGMAATPKRAANVEAALVGAVWSEATLINAAARLGDDFSPLTDWRASSEYRLQVSKNLFRKFWLEQQGDGATVRLSA